MSSGRLTRNSRTQLPLASSCSNQKYDIVRTPSAAAAAAKDENETKQGYPEMKLRGYYSDALGIEAQDLIGIPLVGPDREEDVLWNVFTEKHMPYAETFACSSDVVKQKVTSILQQTTAAATPDTDFPISSFQPKVQLPFFTPPGECPRKVEIERRKRYYAKLDLYSLLDDRNIDTSLLMPKYQDESPENRVILNADPQDPAPFPAFLPLHIFDNTEYDCRNPDEWLAMGMENGDRKPVPGLALLPVRDDLKELDPRDPYIEYKWIEVGMLDYDAENELYLVQKVDANGRVLDMLGHPTINGGYVELGKSRYVMSSQYWIPRIRLMFKAENPEAFADRVAEAFAARKKTEAILRYQLYVDCMPMEGIGELDQASLKRMTETAKGAPSLAKDKDLDDYIQVLEKEVNIDFCRSMNRIIFDRAVTEDRKTFAFVTLPDCFEEKVPIKGCCIDVPEFPFDEQFNKFAFTSLLIRGEVSQAISKVRAECNKVAVMSLFHVTTTKSMRLEEFEQTQSQATAQVALFLKDSWIATLRAAVRTSLRDVGKGWFNIYEKNWEVYLMSKMKKFMEMVKFNMQDALRYLIQDSLVSFTQMILDACYTTLDCPEDFVWDDNMATSRFKPKRNPLFHIELVMDHQTVHYNTPLNSFVTSLINLFDKGIQSLQSVPQLEKFIMEEIFFCDTPLLEAVGMHEPHIEELRNTLRTTISKALIPMKAYACLYEQHLPLMALDPIVYSKDLDTRKVPAIEIKEEIEKYERMQDVLKDSLPPFIVIGPFYISCDAMRQKLSKKCKAISTAGLDLLAKKLRHQADEACEEYKIISKRLFDKPGSIEEVMEMRDWMKTIPEKMEECQGMATKAMQDYDLIEGFNYNLTNEDFGIKWLTIGWPHKINQQINSTTASLLEEEEKFRKLQILDQTTFNDRIDSLTLTVANIPGLSELGKAHEYANHCRRTHKELKEALADASKYNSRERLFGMPITSYDKLNRLVKDFEPYRSLWVTTSDWMRWYEAWMSDPLNSLDAELVEKNVLEAYKTMHKCVRIFADTPGIGDVAATVKGMIEEFKPHIPLIQGLRNPGMRQRHWDMLTGVLGFPLYLKTGLTFAKCLDLKLQDHVEEIAKVAEVAGKEYSIEQVLDKMANDWEPIMFEVMAYKNTGTHIIRTSDEVGQLLDDHIVMTQSMSFSPYKKPFEDRISKWEQSLKVSQEVLDQWLLVQRQWLYLEPIFSSADITRQLPVESKRYQTMERTWRKIMRAAKENPKVITLCADTRLLDSLKECNLLLEQVQKGLSEYLETKRNSFPRFYFLSDDELLEILSQTKDPTAVQPHLRKCFENIAKIKFESDLKISVMYSGEGEAVPFKESLYPDGNVEDWMLKLENTMQESLRQILSEALDDYRIKLRHDWVLNWPGQLVIAGCQTFWTAEVTSALEDLDLTKYFAKMLSQLDNLRELVRSSLSRIGRQILSALIVIEVHARDVVANMIAEQVKNANDFEWISQLRYYWRDNTLFIRAVNAEFPYGFEYLGNNGRLVITPLTDRCYLTLTGALHLRFGGAPAGPAGTGKTETTKDLAKAMAIQCVVFNCSDQLDFMAMGKFFKGLASAGAWACFDEFNRIDIEVLSVVAQQITTIQKAQQQKLERFVFEGCELQLKASCAVFITMNPGYAGRTELPDNLKALFRPVAMMVPDYALIAEISLFSFGFSDARMLSKKIVTTFKLSSEQLSTQDHYDFGMRAVKSVISAAGNLKRQYPDMNEELVTLRAIRDVNVPKFLQDDLKLFTGIVSDLFPNIKEEPIDYGDLLTSLQNTCKKMSLQDVGGFIEKCIQLYETTVVRHGLMLVGPTGSGKTKCYEVLQGAQTSLKGVMSPSGLNFETTHTYILNPKSITMGQLYGEFDALTHEWTDGILCSLIRLGSGATDEEKRWYMFDGPVDAVWIESMNTVLDDNKKLCLTSGEIIKLTDHMTMMFEVADLAVASPATVSRCGMVYLEPSILGLKPFYNCWLNDLCPNLQPHKETFRKLFETFLEDGIDFLRHNVKEIVPSMDSNLTFSVLKILDSFFRTLMPQKIQPRKIVGERPVPEERLKRLPELIESWFCFAIVWGLGATCDNNGRLKFDQWMRETMVKAGVALKFPEPGVVYDYRLDDAGIPLPQEDEEEEEEIRSRKVQWKNWMADLPEFLVHSDMMFSDIIVPTLDTIRSAFMLELLLTNNKTVLCVGPTGTGKSLAISDKLAKSMPKDFVSEFISFSAKTSANQTQDLIDGKLDKRRKGVYGPPVGKYMIFFIDDLNMPALEVYGAQPPIELIRQWMDFKGWYDRRAIGDFRKMVDVNFICAMGPPGGGRNPVTARLMRHFNYLTFTELEDPSKRKIFGAIFNGWIQGSPDLIEFGNTMVDTTISVYNTITTEMLPTPAKSHYTFNLRDLSKVFQGILMADAAKLTTVADLLRVWYHESERVFADRLVNDEDRHWFASLLKAKMLKDFKMDSETVITSDPLLYCDFAGSNSDSRSYGEVVDHSKLYKVLNDFMEDYNSVNTAKMELVLFSDAIRHICRITRIIRQPLGNALLLGVGGSGRQSLTKLSAHISDFELFQIELAKNYGTTEWRDDLKKVMLKAGLDNNPMVFLFSDTQIKKESFLEDLNNILNSGDVPNIYADDELENIYTALKPAVLEADLPPTKTNMFSFFTKRVRANLHTVVTMSPMGEIFRARLRQFPALVNNCTIDWFSEWPVDALRSVAMKFLMESPELSSSEDIVNGLVQMCQEIHSSVAIQSKRFMVELSRYNYVTPTSYLELLQIFNKLLVLKKSEISISYKRTKSGLDKLLTTADEVAVLQIELENMQPELEAATIEAIETVVQITEDTKVAEETKLVVQKEEEEANLKAKATQAIADDAQRDLNEALPALDAALASLKTLNKNDIVEVRALQRPPDGVKMVIDAVCIMKNVKGKKVADEKGVKRDDYWEVGKALLVEPQKFLDSLFKFDKDNISDATIKSIQPYIDNEAFQPAAIAKVSKACTSICQWVRAMHKYHFVALGVAPKREALRIAQEDLAETQRQLGITKMRLRNVEQGLKALQKKYEECVKRKEDLDAKSKECEAKLGRANKLIGGLADEKDRWKESVERLAFTMENIVGDIIVAAGCVAYLGAFTGEYRTFMVNSWIKSLEEFKVPHNEVIGLNDTLSDPVLIRSWQIAGLPKDNLSIENGVIVQFSRRWPLFIDPQGQANKWVKNMEKDNAIEVVKLSDKDFLRSLENSIRFGKPCLLENIGQELDPALEPVLLKQTFKQQGNIVLKLGDTIIPYHSDFKFYITTKLPNPHYTPETSTKVTLVNFTLSPSGLEDQLLGMVVAEERPDLEEAKNQLIINNAKMKSDLKEIEDKILFRLSSSEGSPVDDLDLIQTLEASKIKSGEIKAKVVVAEQTEKDIDATRSQYIPVAINTQILFFCVSDLANIDPMYQYSLEWFINIFINGIRSAQVADNIPGRCNNINDYFTFSLYCNVCRSLFEKHKLLFAFLLCIRILQHKGLIDMDEWRFLLAGGTQKGSDLPNPAPDWLSGRSWIEILMLASLPKFSKIAKEFSDHIDEYKKIFDSVEPHREPQPGHWNDDLDDFSRILVLRCLRPDKVTNAMQDYVVAHIGEKFVEPQTTDLHLVFKDSSPTTPLVFILSVGTDPAADLYKFAEEMRFSKKLSSISLGQGQGPIAENMIRESIEKGLWVFFQNCHLAPSWMPSLERLIEQINPERVHKDFRVWLTSMPSTVFPVYILQNGSKMTVEPPRGIKANLMKSYMSFSDDFLKSCGGEKNPIFKHLLFSLSLFHGVVLERRKFGPLGFNIPYEMTDGDLRICISQLKMFLEEYDDIPYKVLIYTAGHINYGGRVTDDWDRRCLMNILSDFYSSKVISDEHVYSDSGEYKQIDTENDQAGYLRYIKTLPLNDSPDIFGLHDNANITFAQNETYASLNALLLLQPKTSSGGGKSMEEVMEDTAHLILSQVPGPVNMEKLMQKYPVMYEQSMNTVLIQEIIRYNRLLNVIKSSLNDLLKALKGLVVMSQTLEEMATSLYNNQVPGLWAAKAYPSLKPLATWVTDLLARMEFMHDWINNGIPSIFWISGFFFPQAFLTGTLQNFARQKVISIDTIGFDFQVLKESAHELTTAPAEGCYIRGLYIEGARWDPEEFLLSESRAKELYTDVPCIWLKPLANRKQPTEGIYDCPVYKTLTRAGTLSTTGHSTNFVFSIELPTTNTQRHWIKRGVALLCALNY